MMKRWCPYIICIPYFCLTQGRSLPKDVYTIDYDKMYRDLEGYTGSEYNPWLLRSDGSLDSQDPEVIPNLHQGDIAGINPQIWDDFRLGLRWDVFPDRRWDNNTIPYYISHLYKPREYALIKEAIDTLSTLTCVKFVPHDGNFTDYLIIWPVKKPAGCWSFIGKLGGQQVLSLQPPVGNKSMCLGGIGKPMHEIMHAMGIFHEQGRSDRNRYVKVLEDNIVEGMVHNFEVLSEENTTYSYPYDPLSIMHYGYSYFSKNPKKLPTMLPKVNGTLLGQRLMITTTDCLKINDLYECMEEEYERTKYNTLCYYLTVNRKGWLPIYIREKKNTTESTTEKPNNATEETTDKEKTETKGIEGEETTNKENMKENKESGTEKAIDKEKINKKEENRRVDKPITYKEKYKEISKNYKSTFRKDKKETKSYDFLYLQQLISP